MSRVLEVTATPGWFIDTGNPNGPKVRKAAGDQVIQPGTQAASNGSDPAAAMRQAGPDVQVTVSESGKVLVGKTIEVQCQWDGCQAVRVIKPQDAFQVRYCVEHQKAHRKEVHRRKQREKAAARREAQASKA